MSLALDDKFSVGGRSILEFASYEAFLDSLVTRMDYEFLGDHQITRKFVEFGYKGDSEGYTLDEYNRVKADKMAKLRNRYGFQCVLSSGRDYGENYMLRALQQREEPNRTLKQCSVIMVRDRDENGDEISGYIDFAHRLATEDFQSIFDGLQKLHPRKGDISYVNWNKSNVFTNDSRNYEVITNSAGGMKLRNKHDDKILNPNTDCNDIGDNSSRTLVPATDYIHVVIFDHYNRALNRSQNQYN